MSEETKASPLTEWQIDFLRHVLDTTREQVERIVEVLAYAEVIPPPIPTDPRERALHLRKHRSTGPGKPIQNQRRRT